MIHVYDDKFDKVKDAFHEAYYTHTSTSPNYQIIASLDLSRRQVDLEGFKLVSNNYQKAQIIRKRINEDPVISKVFKVLSEEDLIPSNFRAIPSGKDIHLESIEHHESFDKAWKESEFVLDPTRITLCTTEAGIGGNEFKDSELMDKCNIQVNKTSLNNVLFIITIGATWGGVDYLLESLRKLAREYTARFDGASAAERKHIKKKIAKLREGAGDHEPSFSEFHHSLTHSPNAGEGDMRTAFFLAYEEENKEYILLKELLDMMEEKKLPHREFVCASFIIPYPPGFPILVPGQVITKKILEFMESLDIKEIHGYDANLGLPILKDLRDPKK